MNSPARWLAGCGDLSLVGGSFLGLADCKEGWYLGSVVGPELCRCAVCEGQVLDDGDDLLGCAGPVNATRESNASGGLRCVEQFCPSTRRGALMNEEQSRFSVPTGCCATLLVAVPQAQGRGARSE